MNAHQKLHQLKLQEWIPRFSEQKESGLTIREWCKENGISIHKYNYWKRCLKEEPQISPTCGSNYLNKFIYSIFHLE